MEQKKDLMYVKENFVSESNVKDCIESIKIIKSEGYDCLPQRVLVVGIPHLFKPLTKLFNLIYNQRNVGALVFVEMCKDLTICANKATIISSESASNESFTVVFYKPLSWGVW